MRASGDRPFWSTISARTAAQGSLSSLSMAEQMGRNLAAGTPHTRIIASSSRRWLSLMRKRPMSSVPSASASTCTRAWPALHRSACARAAQRSAAAPPPAPACVCGAALNKSNRSGRGFLLAMLASRRTRVAGNSGPERGPG